MMRKLRRELRAFKVSSWEYRFVRLFWPLRRVWRTSRTAILIGVAVLALLMLYSRIVYFSGESGPVWDWWNTLISTLASVALAIVAGFILFRLQSSDTSQVEEHEMESLLYSEVIKILDKLQENLPEREEPYPPKYPPKREIPASELKPELHETHFKFIYFDTRFIERAFESGMLPLLEQREARTLIGQLHEYNQHVAHLRALSLNADALQEGESRYLQQAKIVLLVEKRLAKQARNIIRIVWNREKRREG